MKITITNQSVGYGIIYLIFLLPWFPVLTGNQSTFYNLSKDVNYVSDPFYETENYWPTSKYKSLKEHGEARTQYRKSIGISSGTLWLSRLRFIELLVTTLFSLFLSIKGIHSLITGKIKFKKTVEITIPWFNKSEDDELFNLGQKIRKMDKESKADLRAWLNENP